MKHPTSDPVDTALKARLLALKILNRIEAQNQTLDQVLEETLTSSDLTEKRDRAFLNALVLGVSRWRGRCQAGRRLQSSQRRRLSCLAGRYSIGYSWRGPRPNVPPGKPRAETRWAIVRRE